MESLKIPKAVNQIGKRQTTQRPKEKGQKDNNLQNIIQKTKNGAT